MSYNWTILSVAQRVIIRPIGHNVEKMLASMFTLKILTFPALFVKLLDHHGTHTFTGSFNRMS